MMLIPPLDTKQYSPGKLIFMTAEENLKNEHLKNIGSGLLQILVLHGDSLLEGQ